MNDRERFRRLMAGRPTDRPPFLEEGVREEVLERWHKQGLPLGKTHIDLFGLTPHERVGPDLKFPSETFGRLFDLSASEYRKAFTASANRFPHDWNESVNRLENRTHIVCIWASRGFFQALGVGDWPTFEKVLIGTVREPAKIKDRLELYGEFCAEMLELTLRDVDPEFIYLSEPISSQEGPLISPAMFQEFMIPVYRRIVATARSRGCDNILLSTYGDSSLLLPMLMKAGISMLWISEASEKPEMDYRRIRSRFGPQLALVGGIPMGVLRSEPPEKVRDSLEEIVPPLLASGRYIPLAGGRVRKDISWSAYRCYREILAELMA